jgi:acetolactate synthase-1/2/3 large subunit
MTLSAPHSARSGGRLLVDQLLRRGAQIAFCVPGESYLPILDSLYESRGRIRTVSCRHDGAAAFMAEACGKLTGRPGICFVTRGPGATNASIAIHVAYQDSTPMLLGIGQVPREELGREAFQEIDLVRMFAPIAKHVEQIEDAAAIPAVIDRAWTIAMSARPGPVVLVLPEDVLQAQAEAEDMDPLPVVPRAPSASDLQRLHAELARAERPFVIAGGSAWSNPGLAALRSYAEAADLPVAVSFRRQDLIDNASPSYCGYLGLNAHEALWQRLEEADCIWVLGARLDQPTLRDYQLFAQPSPARRVVHVYPEAATFGRVVVPEMAIHADPGLVVSALQGLPVLEHGRWAQWRAAARAEYEAAANPVPSGVALDLGRVMQAINAALPKDTIVALDAGNFTAWPQRFRSYTRPGRLLAPVNGAMGYGVPAAVAASLLHPDRTVIGFAGDGGMLMTGNELATAVQYGAKPIIIVVNNGMYGTIRLHQERTYPGRAIATDLENPDFAAYARAFGAHGETVRRDSDFADALARARASGRAAVIELQTDPEVLLPGLTFSDLARRRRPNP